MTTQLQMTRRFSILRLLNECPDLWYSFNSIYNHIVDNDVDHHEVNRILTYLMQSEYITKCANTPKHYKITQKGYKLINARDCNNI